MSRARGSVFWRSLLAGLFSALVCGASAMAQAPATAALLQDAEALQTRFAAWRNTVKEMTLNESLPPQLSLDAKRSNCLFWIKATDDQIAWLKRKPALDMEVGLLSHMTLLDNAFSNLGHALELARATLPLTGQAEIKEPTQEKRLNSLRKELQRFYSELSPEVFQQLHAAGEASQAGERYVSHQPDEISGHVYRAVTGKPLADAVVTLESPASPQGDKIQRTSLDGSYEFVGLAPGIYWVTAYRNGFVGSVYGVGASQNASKGLIFVGASQKLRGIDFQLTRVPRIKSVSLDALTAEFPNLHGDVHLVAGNSHFTVTAWYGQLAMVTPDGADPYTIATGGRALDSFLFDPKRSIVYYPVPGRYDPAIVAFALNKRKYRRIALPLGEGLRLLDEKPAPGGAVVAYRIHGPCVPKALANGENPWILPKEPLTAELPWNVCVVTIPLGTWN
jgi:hypothetical protein